MDRPTARPEDPPHPPTTSRGWLLVGLGAGGALCVALLAWRERTQASPQVSMAGFVLLGLASLVLLSSGVAQLASAADPAHEEPTDYRHTYRLFGLLGAALGLAMVARMLAVPATFGEYGHYRGAAATEARTARVPRLQGKEACRECHDYQYGNHEKDVHRTVQCEDCHGPGDVHVKADEKTGNIIVPKTRDWCLVCHRALPARPGPFPQITWRDHFRQMGVRDDKLDSTQCIDCHDPHEPLFLQKPLAEARLHPLIHRCRDCHVGRAEPAIGEKLVRPADHPAIFECGYCHTQRAKDWETTPHYQVKCTTCHLFIRESDFAGRIVLNRDPRFCLLCHEKKDFRDGKDAKGNAIDDEKFAHVIEWPKHLKDVGAESTGSDTPCTNCHGAQLHGDSPKSNIPGEPTGAKEAK